MKQFKKSDLKTGMRILMENGYLYLVLIDFDFKGKSLDCIVNTDGTTHWIDLANYTDDFEYLLGNDKKIIKIFKPKLPYSMTNLNDARYLGEVVWEREDNTFIEIDGVGYSEEEIRHLIKMKNIFER
jgi:hypothetical protein